MPTPTYTPLATVTVGSLASSVTFSSIPATYRDLILVGNGTIFGTEGTIRFNNDSTSNYTAIGLLGDINGAGSFADSTALVFFNKVPMTGILQIMDYSTTDKHKTYLHRDGSTTPSGFITAQAGRWSNTAAITTVSIHAIGGPGTGFSPGVTFNLYGIVG
jgi:hypothetical protein